MTIELLCYKPRPIVSTLFELMQSLDLHEVAIVVSMYDKPMHCVVLPATVVDRYVYELLDPMLTAMGFGPEVRIEVISPLPN